MTIKALKRACLEKPLGPYFEGKYSGKSDKSIASNNLEKKFDLCVEVKNSMYSKTSCLLIKVSHP
ncbi:hypothetical protein [Caminicella sporogenes]|uniref:hypothetical protein n=1 Tax=Caminicella sporogenes TaxID=166485 RepID=UPI000E766996|nr:hypothetical protein [Caminicella sporogenes]